MGVVGPKKHRFNVPQLKALLNVDEYVAHRVVGRLNDGPLCAVLRRRGRVFHAPGRVGIVGRELLYGAAFDPDNDAA